MNGARTALLTLDVRRRGPALVGVAALPLVVLALSVWERQGDDRFDADIQRDIGATFGPLHGFFLRWIRIGSPAGVAIACGVLGLVCLLLRRWRAFALVALGPLLTGVLGEQVLKPVVDRKTESGGLAFPSGHTGGAMSVAFVVVILLMPGGGLHLSLSRWLVALVDVLALVAAALAGLGMAVLHRHYPTDILGGMLLAFVAVFGVALMIDRVRDGPLDS